MSSFPRESLDEIAGGRGSLSTPVASPSSGDGPSSSWSRKNGLFRPESQQEYGAGAYGKPIAGLPVSWQLLTLMVLCLVVAAGLILTFSSFERRETASGILRTRSGEAKVLPIDRGVITHVHVSEGDLVRAGATLVTFSSDRTDPSGQIPQHAMMEALGRQQDNLKKRIGAIKETSGFERMSILARRRSVEASLVAATASLRSAQAQLALAREEYDRALPVANRGFLSRTDIVRRKQAVVIGEENVAQAVGRAASLEADIEALDAEAAAQPLQSVEKSGSLEDAFSETVQRRAQYQLKEGFTVRAPIPGRVTALQATKGATADPLLPLLTIVPDSAPVVAVLYVPSRGIGMLKVGQEVRLRYDAFPFERYGPAKGRVHSISRTVVTPDKVEDAVRLAEPSYRVVVELEKQTMDAFGKRFSLQPGMALTGDIVLERRSLAAWIFAPLLSLKGRL